MDDPEPISFPEPPFLGSLLQRYLYRDFCREVRHPLPPKPGGLPHKDMTRREAVRYLESLRNTDLHVIDLSPRDRLDWETPPHFQVRMILKDYARRVLRRRAEGPSKVAGVEVASVEFTFSKPILDL